MRRYGPAFIGTPPRERNPHNKVHKQNNRKNPAKARNFPQTPAIPNSLLFLLVCGFVDD